MIENEGKKEEPGGAVGVNSSVTGKATEGLKVLTRSLYREGVYKTRLTEANHSHRSNKTTTRQ